MAFTKLSHSNNLGFNIQQLKSLNDLGEDLDRVAAFVADADATSLATLKTSIDNLKNALVAAGLMAAS